MRSFFLQALALATLVALAGCDESRDPFGPADAGAGTSSGTEVTPEAPFATGAAPAADAALASLTSSRILFMSWSATERADIWTVDPQSGGYVHLTNTSTISEYAPAWSYDHKRVAFVKSRLDANQVSHYDIYLMNADGTNKHWARSTPSSANINEPSWAPDGTHLVVTTELNGESALATLDLSTGKLALVAPKGQSAAYGYKASYDPSGMSILYLDSHVNKVHRLVPGGADQVLLTADQTVQNATFSPDGKKVAYSRYVSGTNTEVFVLTLATGISKRLTTNAAVDEWPTWSPDGTKLAFLSHRSGSHQIWTMNASTGGSLTRITNVVNASKPAWWH